MATKISTCRVCPCKRFDQILTMGKMGLTGHFPRPGEQIDELEIDLVQCVECGLVQLAHNYDLTILYGQNYGYRSGLNQQMVSHLKEIAEYCMAKVKLCPGDFIIDIGSNDGTTLGFYPNNCRRVGIDPTASKFRQFYPEGVEIVEQFFPFTSDVHFSNVKIVNSIACFYDLTDPVNFAKEVAKILSPNGIWILEMSYLPSMLHTKSYDTICHEHLEYYDLKQIKSILGKAGFKIYEFSSNSANGGSMRVCAGLNAEETCLEIDEFIEAEQAELSELLQKFPKVIRTHKEELVSLLNSLFESKMTVYIYGASTKGNVLLQYCGINAKQVKKVAEVNEDKFGCVTPITNIPIEDENIARAENPDYFLVLPWHFREGILKKESKFLSEGGKFIFPLPRVEIVGFNGIIDL